MVFQKMSKNYSLIEIKSLLENIQDEIFSILLDSSSNSNSHYFQNFTGIALRTIKYLNHYLNVLKHDEHLGSILSYIFQNLQRSFNEYKSRNIYFQSCLTSPLAQNEDEQKQQDQIYHFMNTRNKDIPLQILGNPDQERERMELALFVENMSKKKVTLKQPKRSLRLPQEHQNGLKILRKTTYDPSFHPTALEDQIKNQPLAQVDKMKDNEEVQVQTQTDCVLHEYETQTQKQQDESKSLAQSYFKSEIAVATIQNLQDSVKKKNKATFKNKKNLKGTDIKASQKKKKAQIASSIKQNSPSEDISLKSSKKQTKNQTNSNKMISLQRQCSIKALCTQTEAIKLSSKQVNVIYNKNYFQILQNQIQENQTLKEYQTEMNKSQQTKTKKTKGAIQITGKKNMEVIAEAMEEYNHPELKSDASCRPQMLNDQIAITTNQAVDDTKHNFQTKKHNTVFNKNQIRQSQMVHIASVKFDQDVDLVSKNNENQKAYPKNTHKSSSPNKKQILLNSNKNQIVDKQSSTVHKQQNMKLQQQEDQIKQKKDIQLNEDEKQLQVNKQISNQINQRLIAQTHSQNIEDSHLAPIKQTTPNTNQRFSKFNVIKSKIEYMSRRLKNKCVHSTDYLDKYVNKDDLKNNQGINKQFEGRSSPKKGSLIIINNRTKIVEQKSEYNKQRESLSANQPAPSNKTKVKLVNLFKLRNGQANSKKTVKDQNNIKNNSLEKEMSQDRCYSLKSSEVKMYTEEKEGKRFNTVLRNKKIAQNCYIVNTQSQYHLIARQLRQKNKRQLIRQYLDLIQASHKKFCGQRCVHIENLYKKINFDGSKSEEDIIEQLLRLIKKGK